jgi:opacity protein-like surface antigen
MRTMGTRSGGMRRRTTGVVVATVVAVAGLTMTAGAARAQQGLAAYDYTNLGFRGIAAEVFAIYPNDTNNTVAYGGRVNLGYLGPNVRVQLRGGYWSSEMKTAVVEEFATRIADLVEDQNGARPSIDLGVIERSAVIAGTDFHWVFLPTSMFTPYLGVGGELMILSGSGDAIDGTFVEDSLDLLTFGVSGIGGLEVAIGSNVSVFGEFRGSLASGIRSIAWGGGIGFHW